MSRRKAENKEESALRIMDALSGVDKELLERSDGKQPESIVGTASDRTAQSGEGVVVYKFVRRHGKALAACLCLCVLGTAFWGMSRLVLAPHGSTGKSSDTVRENSTSTAGAPEAAVQIPTEGAAEEYAESVAEVQPETDFAESASGVEAEEPQWIGMQLAEAVIKNSQQADYGDVIDEEEKKQIDELQMSVSEGMEPGEKAADKENAVATDGSSGADACREISWEEARSLKDVGVHVPDRVPEGYEAICVRLRDAGEGRSRLTLLWNNGEKNLWLNVTETGCSSNMRFDSEPPLFTVEEDWKNLLPKPDGDGAIQFGLLLEDGVLVEYQGYLTENEIVELFDSIQ